MAALFYTQLKEGFPWGCAYIAVNSLWPHLPAVSLCVLPRKDEFVFEKSRGVDQALGSN